MSETFGKDYFVGNANGTSNYVDYRLKKFDQLRDDLISTCNIRPNHRVLDFGCATGALVFSFKTKGYDNMIGTDLSMWALEEGRKMFGLDPNTLQYMNMNAFAQDNDFVIALDVFEHCPTSQLHIMMHLLSKFPPAKGLIVRIPVSKHEGEDFVLDVSKNDRTHIQIHSKDTWEALFAQYGFECSHVFANDAIYDSEGVLARAYTFNYNKRGNNERL